MAAQVWGGVEITCNRVRDEYIDQVQCSGHASRLDDLDAIAELGIRKLRIGLLWEHYEQDKSWKGPDARLSRMQRLGLEPIAGLVHHGSGPPHTDLLDPEFATKAAAYAQLAAERYPWIKAYTPINEPHTTARFSGMYGIWYPHHMSRLSYLRALLHEVQATVLCMRAIRRVQPAAKLIQTEDTGRIWTTSPLHGLGEMLNERRWLPFDLLCGRVGRHHPMFEYLIDAGIGENEILWFQDHPCPPDVVGLNYYLTSDRFLDHRVDLYPRRLGSAEGRFIDVEAVRVREEGIAGFGSMLTEAWQRYGIPVAITEVHLGGHVDEQIRWLAEAWNDVKRARSHGVDCPALTVWALLGSHYWNELVQRRNGHYEPGGFDVSGGVPVETQLAEVVRQIARGEQPNHPALGRVGWWRRDDRILYRSRESMRGQSVPAPAY